MNASVPMIRPQGCPPGQGTTAQPHGGQIGTPPYVPTDHDRELVRKLATVLSERAIADVIGIGQSTLRKYFLPIIAEERAKITKELGLTVIQKARNGSEDMIKFYLTRMGGWDDKRVHEHVGEGGGPIQINHAHVAALFAGMNDDELAVAERILAAIAGGVAVQPSGSGGGTEAPEGGETVPAP